MQPRPPLSSRTDTLFPESIVFRSRRLVAHGEGEPDRRLPLPWHSRVRRPPRTAFGGRNGSPVSRAWRRLPALRYRPAFLHGRSEELTSELQSLMRISYAVFCLQKKTTKTL